MSACFLATFVENFQFCSHFCISSQALNELAMSINDAQQTDEALRNSLYVWGAGIASKHSRALPDRVHGVEGFGPYTVVVGSNHVGVVTTTDHLFMWGDNDAGQLGKGDVNQRKLPRRVRALCGVRVLKVACGRRHSLMLTDDGVFGAGSNAHGQLGLGFVESKHYKQPMPLTNLASMFVHSYYYY
jgi:hypothetical protein